MYYGDCDVTKARILHAYLRENFADLSYEVIGYSALKREIIAYTVGRKNGLLICAAFHSMEHLTATIAFKFLNEVLLLQKHNKVIANALKTSGLTVIPMMNPDGIEISIHGADTAKHKQKFVNDVLQKANIPHTQWQANANAVDLNHNFDADFSGVKEREKEAGITSPSPTRYGGEYPESESETKALCNYCKKHSFSKAVALHTQGQEIYYDFGKNTPKESLTLANNLATLSGYKVSHPEAIAVGGGFKDWFIEYFKKPAFTLEIGLGKNPLPNQIIETEYPKVSKMLRYLLKEDYTVNKSCFFNKL